MALIRVKKAQPRTEWVAVDTETSGLSPYAGDRPFAVTVYNPFQKGNEVHYVEWPVDCHTREVAIGHDPYLHRVLRDESIVKCFHNAKFDLEMLEVAKYDVAGRVEDTSFAARVCNSLEPSFRLKDLARRYCGVSADDEAELDAAVAKMRAKARKLGWAIRSGDDHQKEEDYWLVQYAAELGFPEEWAGLCRKYCSMDGIRTGFLWERKYKRLLEDPVLRNTYEWELTLLPIAMKMERRGMGLSRELAQAEKDAEQQRSDHHLFELREMVQKPDFNPGSTTQLPIVLYSREPVRVLKKEATKTKPAQYEDFPVTYGLKCMKRTEGGGYSTDWKALRPYQEHPFVRELMLYRSSSKAIETFFGKYLRMSVPDIIVPGDDNWALHCSLNQCGTLTGRFSCSSPPLQCVANPESSPRGTDIHARRPFGPRKGFKLYGADYGQMELRVFAECAQVTSLLSEIAADRDPNNYLTNRAWGGKGNPAALEAMAHSLELGHDHPTRDIIQRVWDEYGWNGTRAKMGMRSGDALAVADWYLERHEYDIVTAEKSIGKKQSRQRGKTVMFVKYYGGGGSACADILYVSEREAKKFLRDLDVQFPEINTYINELSARAASDRYIITRYGRKLMVDPEYSYRAVNYMIQGSCADLMKRSIIKVNNLFEQSGLDAHCLLTIHDELLMEIKDGDDKPWLMREICRLMTETDGALKVPMIVEVQVAAHSWEEKSSYHIPDPPKIRRRVLA